MLVDLQRIATTGQSHYPHPTGGSRVRLGLLQGLPPLRLTSPIEITLHETTQGRNTRPARVAMADYYVVRQLLISELLLQCIGTTWSQVSSSSHQSDDPDAALIFYDISNHVIATIDTPGFVAPPGVANTPQSPYSAVAIAASAVSLQQNYRLWIEINNRYSSAVASISNDIYWHHFLHLERSSSSAPWSLNTQKSFLGRGTRPSTFHP